MSGKLSCCQTDAAAVTARQDYFHDLYSTVNFGRKDLLSVAIVT